MAQDIIPPYSFIHVCPRFTNEEGEAAESTETLITVAPTSTSID